MEEIVITTALRTPSGRPLGGLSPLTAPELCSQVVKEAIRRSEIKPYQVDEVIMGNVVSAGMGQNPARQAAILAGLPYGVSALTVNMVCASGLRAIALGAQAIRLGEADVIVAGGMESMSNAPFLLREMRGGRKFGDSVCVDAFIYDGLWDRFYGAHMGTLCELTAKRYGISRKDQDTFALKSHKKAMKASRGGFFKEETVPVRVKKNGVESVVDTDETIRWDTSLRKLARLKPVFKKGGTITAGNAPGLNDGAACVLLMSGKKARRLKVKPLAEIVGWSSGHLDPRWYPVAPLKSVKALLKKTGLKVEDFDLIEENEAFAAQTLAVIKGLSLDPEKVNVNGGALALGHPIGASGARILVTLIHALKKRKKRLGLATLCLGGGGAVSMAIRSL
ncbi:MAG: acetyl-CoA C-acetyltransferase [Thermodesulfobacteriota bacterium]|nr:MAG: acetyl-CoA C-acetyltransferase [Thermodesulfobacteriota bacterium]